MSKPSNYFNVYRISLLAIVTALTTVGRLAFALPFMPNIQPMTALLLIIALNIGILDSLIVSLLSILLTNLFLGMGPWTVLQILSFAFILLLTGSIKYFYRTDSFVRRLLFAGWAGLMGFVYGFVISYFSFLLYGMNNFWVYYFNGVPFDFLHAVGNIGFFFILEPIIVPIIKTKFANVLH